MRRMIAAGVLAGCVMMAGRVMGDVTPSALFSDHMVVQQEMPVPVWGRAEAGEEVTVTLAGQTVKGVAGADGKWMVKLAAVKPTEGPVEMTIAGKNTVTIKDVLIGEVWVGSGQSNMEFTVSKSVARFAGLVNEEQEIAAAKYPTIRMFTVKGKKSYVPLENVVGKWEVCSPETVPGFSAVGYLFARELQKEIKRPVGIVTTAAGASTAEAWISRETLVADPELKKMVDGFDAQVAFFKEKPAALMGEAPKKPVTINGRPAAATARQTDPVQDQHQPTVQFNGMVAPIIPFAMRGVLWYQGESIVGGDHGIELYPKVQKALIEDWRKQ